MAITKMDASATVGVTEFSYPNNSTTLTPQTDDAVIQFWLDVSALAAGDQFQVTIYEKIDAGTQRVVYQSTLSGVQFPPQFATPAVIVTDGWDCTCKKLAGTDRIIAGSVRKVA